MPVKSAPSGFMGSPAWSSNSESLKEMKVLLDEVPSMTSALMAFMSAAVSWMVTTRPSADCKRDPPVRV